MIDLIFWLPTPLLFFSGIPQTIKLIKTKQSGDISKLMYAMTWLAVGIIFSNALIDSNTQIAIANGTSFIMLTINFFLILKYDAKNG